MISYRFKRRAFLTAMSGGLGLKVMLRNLEASAQTAKSPARLLVTHWPVGIVAGSGNALWTPTTGSVGGSPGLKPFDDMKLGADVTVFRGIGTDKLNTSGGGSHEQGTVSLVTGLSAGGTRTNCCEGDDAFAAPGGSVDQILLKAIPGLKSPMGGPGYANSIADSRTDYAEKSTQTLSYSTNTQTVTKYQNGGTATEAIPLAPVLSPLQQFNNIFNGIAPGGGSGGAGGGGGMGAGGAGGSSGVDTNMLRQLACRKSVLDFALEEINQLKTMVPADARNKLDIHTTEIMNAESSVTMAINTRYPGMTGAGGSGGGMMGAGGSSGGGVCPTTTTGGMSCKAPPAPPNEVGGQDPANGRGSSSGANASVDDSMLHQRVGKAHLDILKAAFVCDLIRVGTYQWSPGTNHVSFSLYPSSTQFFQHHPTSHRISTGDTTAAATVAALNANAQFLFNVQTWYFARHAENMAAWKTAVDGCGNSLLDFTVVPFVTEVRATSHERNDMPAMIIGGKALGFAHNLYKSGTFTINQYWGTVAQAFGYTGTSQAFGTPIAGVWTKPA